MKTAFLKSENVFADFSLTFFKHSCRYGLALRTDAMSIFRGHSKLVTRARPQVLYKKAVGVPGGRHFPALSVALVSSVC